ncbi:MFS transporter, partial [[Ruminococcus] gnavus]|nr:MFS transporter [Mediterraneibacter gnavus]
FSRKIGSTIASTGVSFGLAAIGFVSGSNVVQTAEAVNGIYFLVNIIPVVTCALELIGVGLIFNLNKETTEQMYAELKAK